MTRKEKVNAWKEHIKAQKSSGATVKFWVSKTNEVAEAVEITKGLSVWKYIYFVDMDQYCMRAMHDTKDENLFNWKAK